MDTEHQPPDEAAPQQTFSGPTRWEIELEFVQSLSNIQYVYYLAQEGYLTQPNFRNYLAYLQYWNQPQYSKFLVYPNCLHVLTLLQHDLFAKDIQNPEFRNLLMNDMVGRWQLVSGDGSGLAPALVAAESAPPVTVGTSESPAR